MKRIAIFTVYDKEGIIEEYIDYFLIALKDVAEDIIVVVNGNARKQDVSRLKSIVSHIYIRDNTGFDAGAYKDCIFNYIGIDTIKKYDELIIANDTCYGPLKSFNDIFNDMAENKCDFWGIKRMNLGFMTYLQSWFLVFKKNILMDYRFYDYWNKFINEKSCDIRNVYSCFEIGIYRYLVKCGFKSGVYKNGDNQVHVYKSSYYDLKDEIPFIKRKIFVDGMYTDNNVFYSLEYIKEKSEYPLEIILNNAKRQFNKIIDLEELKKKCNKPAICVICSKIKWSEDMFLNKIKKFKKIYIYGAGIWAYNIYYYLISININIDGFFVTESLTMDNINGIKVMKWNNENIDKDCGIIAAMNDINSKQIYPKYCTNNNFIWLWEGLNDEIFNFGN